MRSFDPLAPARTALKRQFVEGPLRDPALAVIGAADALTEAVQQHQPQVLRAAGLLPSLPSQVAGAYSGLVLRGRARVVDAGAQKAVRERGGRAGQRLAPRAGRAAVRLDRARLRIEASPRTQKAREAVRRAALRMAEANQPDEGVPPQLMYHGWM